MLQGHTAGSCPPLCPPGTPGIFLQSCFIAGQSTAYIDAWGSCPDAGFVFPLLKFMRLLSAHFSSLYMCKSIYIYESLSFPDNILRRMLQAASFNQIISFSLIFQMLSCFITWEWLVIFIDELWMAIGKLVMGKCSDNVAIDILVIMVVLVLLFNLMEEHKYLVWKSKPDKLRAL